MYCFTVCLFSKQALLIFFMVHFGAEGPIAVPGGGLYDPPLQTTHSFLKQNMYILRLRSAFKSDTLFLQSEPSWSILGLIPLA